MLEWLLGNKKRIETKRQWLNQSNMPEIPWQSCENPPKVSVSVYSSARWFGKTASVSVGTGGTWLFYPCSFVFSLYKVHTSTWLFWPLRKKYWPPLHLNTQSVPRSKHNPSRLQKTSQLMLYREIFLSDILTKHINKLWCMVDRAS